MSYDPSDVGRKGTLFGLPYSRKEADIIVIPVPLDVTASYGDGTSLAPTRILQESSQLDLSIPGVVRPWELKVAMEEPDEIFQKQSSFRNLAAKTIARLEAGEDVDELALKSINDYCERVAERVRSDCDLLLEQGKIPVILGGDHSSPLGLIQSLSDRGEFGILQIDAHMDLRQSYEGFHFSHASIMNNALLEDGVTTLIQVGIRDFCEEEEQFIKSSGKPISVFYDEIIYQEREQGKSMMEISKEIVDTLPRKVYVSFDIDGLDPSLCPNTGTPVPGGLNFNDVIILLRSVIESGKEIIGFDLCEVGNHAWDANAGARVLYRLLVSMGLTKKLLKKTK